MFKTNGFMTEEKAAQAANAFEQATHSLVLKKAMENVKKEREGEGSMIHDVTPSIQARGSDLSAANSDEAASRNRNDDDDDMFEADDDDDVEFRRLREQRMEALKNQKRQMQDNILKGHGKYEDIVEEDFLKAVTGSKYCVCAFYHRDFERCKIVDKHLGILAQKHLPTRFIKVNAEKSPFFVGKLAIRVLPTIVCFIDGVAVDRVVGFEEFGGVDDFKTIVMEARLEKAGVVASDNTVREYKREQQAKKGTVQKRSMHW